MMRNTRSKIGSTASSESSTMQFIGRRTGKVFSIASYDELFSDSETDASLDITRTPKVTEESTIVSKAASKLVSEEECTKHDGTFNRPLSRKEKIKSKDARFGRRTGKDLFAGNKKLQETGKIENFNDLFSDTDESMSLHPTPEKTISSASLASCEESDVPANRSVRRKKSLHNKSLPPVKSITRDVDSNETTTEDDLKHKEMNITDENINASVSSSAKRSRRWKGNRGVLNSSSTSNTEFNSSNTSLKVAGVAEVSLQKPPDKFKPMVEFDRFQPSSPLISSTRIESMSASRLSNDGGESDPEDNENNATITPLEEDDSDKHTSSPAKSSSINRSKTKSNVPNDSCILNSSKSEIVGKRNNTTITLEDEYNGNASSPVRSSTRNRSRVSLNASSSSSDGVVVNDKSGTGGVQNKSLQSSVLQQKESNFIVLTEQSSDRLTNESGSDSPRKMSVRKQKGNETLVTEAATSKADIDDDDDGHAEQHCGRNENGGTKHSDSKMEEEDVSLKGKDNQESISKSVTELAQQDRLDGEEECGAQETNQPGSTDAKHLSSVGSTNEISHSDSEPPPSHASNEQTPTDPGNEPSTSHYPGLDFGGTAAGSVSNADKVLPNQFFGIKKRLTFCSSAGESRHSLEADSKGGESFRNRKSSPGSFLVHHSKEGNEASTAQVFVGDNDVDHHAIEGLDMSIDDGSDGFQIVDRDIDAATSQKLQNSFVTITGRKRSSSGDGGGKETRTGQGVRKKKNEKTDDSGSNAADNASVVKPQSVSIDGKDVKDAETGDEVDAGMDMSVADGSLGTNVVDKAQRSSISSTSSGEGGTSKLSRSKIPVRQQAKTEASSEKKKKKTGNKSVPEQRVSEGLSSSDSDSGADGIEMKSVSNVGGKGSTSNNTRVKQEKGIEKRKAMTRKVGRRKPVNPITSTSDAEDSIDNENGLTPPPQSAHSPQQDSSAKSDDGESPVLAEVKTKKKKKKEDVKAPSKTNHPSSIRKRETRLQGKNKNVAVDEENKVDGDTKNGTFTLTHDEDIMEDRNDIVSPGITVSEVKPLKNKKSKDGSKKSLKRGHRKDKTESAALDNEEEEKGNEIHQGSRIANRQRHEAASSANTSPQDDLEEKEADYNSPFKKPSKNHCVKNAKTNNLDDDEEQIDEVDHSPFKKPRKSRVVKSAKTDRLQEEEMEEDAPSPVKKSRKNLNAKSSKRDNPPVEDREESSGSLSRSPPLSRKGSRTKKLLKRQTRKTRKVSTPLHPMAMLARVSPKSGVSFRRKSSFIPSCNNGSSDDQHSPQDDPHESDTNDEGSSTPSAPRGGSASLKARKRALINSLGEEDLPPERQSDSNPIDESDTNDEGSLTPSAPRGGSASLKARKRALINSLGEEDLPPERQSDSNPIDDENLHHEPDAATTTPPPPLSPPPVSRSRSRKKSGRTSSLRKKAILESARNKGLRVIVGNPLTPSSPVGGGYLYPFPTAGESPETDSEGHCEDTTVLPSPSSSPVHYAETTMSNERRRSSIAEALVLPDLSYKIIPPEQSQSGLRRSKRTRVQRLHDYKGEGIVYRRDSAGFRVVHSIMPSVPEAKILALERKRNKNRVKRKMQAKAVPAKTRRMSSHVAPQPDRVTDNAEISVINPDTEERVVVELMAHSHNAKWIGPDLSSLTHRDTFGMNVLLNQPSFCSGELHIRPLCEKPRQLTVETVVYFLIHGKVCVTVNNSSFVVENRDHFFIPRGSVYKIKNLRRDIAQLQFLNLHDSRSGHSSNWGTGTTPVQCET